MEKDKYVNIKDVKKLLIEQMNLYKREISSHVLKYDYAGAQDCATRVHYTQFLIELLDKLPSCEFDVGQVTRQDELSEEVSHYYSNEMFIDDAFDRMLRDDKVREFLKQGFDYEYVVSPRHCGKTLCTRLKMGMPVEK